MCWETAARASRPAAMWQDGKLGLSHVSSFERIAVVTDNDARSHTREARRLDDPRRATAVLECREREQAVTWASSNLDEA